MFLVPIYPVSACVIGLRAVLTRDRRPYQKSARLDLGRTFMLETLLGLPPQHYREPRARRPTSVCSGFLLGVIGSRSSRPSGLWCAGGRDQGPLPHQATDDRRSGRCSRARRRGCRVLDHWPSEARAAVLRPGRPRARRRLVLYRRLAAEALSHCSTAAWPRTCGGGSCTARAGLGIHRHPGTAGLLGRPSRARPVVSAETMRAHRFGE
jgi:hypothetical protein